MQLETTQLNDHIWYIDNGLLHAPGTGSTYVVRGDETAIIETGASHCVPHILEGLQRLGIKPADVRHVVLTHIHMDHAGGTGTLLPHLPEATVYIHSRTAQYLTDPSKLLQSAERALGSLYALHLPVEPVPAERITPADDLRLDLGRGVVLRSIYSPGHSADHLAYYEEGSRALFCGDSLGVQMPIWSFVGPVTPPPAANIAVQRETFDTLAALDIDTLMFSHFGPGQESPRALIQRERERYEQLVEMVHTAWQQGNVDHAAIIQAMMTEQPSTPEGEAIVVGWLEMSIKGLVHAFERQAKKEHEAAEQGRGG
jgi:glyoxylase-like metal-dependent hydrolase (beta-lactamase superfamily II)